MLDERDPELADFAGAGRVPKQHGQGHNRDQRLPENFLTRRDAIAVFVHHLQVIVPKAHGGERGINKERRHDPHIGRRPQHRAQEHTAEDEQAPHRGRILFVETLREVPGPIVIVVLAKLQPAQLVDQPRTDDKSDDRRRPRGAKGAHTDVTEHTERSELVRVFCEITKHGRRRARGPPAERVRVGIGGCLSRRLHRGND